MSTPTTNTTQPTRLNTIISLLSAAMTQADLDQRPALAGAIRRVRGHAQELIRPADLADLRRAAQGRKVKAFQESITNPKETQ